MKLSCVFRISTVQKLLVFFLLCFGILAEDGNKAKLSLISESLAIGGKSQVLLGLRTQIEPGWKTYWRSPGIAGYGLKLDTEGSKNVKSLKILWPLPHRSQTQFGLVHAYEGDVTFPLVVDLLDPNQPAHVALNVDMLVCDAANCLPIMETLTLNIPPGTNHLSPDAPLLQQALSQVPKKDMPFNELGFHIQGVVLENGQESPPKIHVTLAQNEGTFEPSDLPELMIEMKDHFVDPTQVSLSKDQKSIVYTAPIFRDEHRQAMALQDLIGQSVILTFGYKGKGYETTQILRDIPHDLGFWVGILLIAFIGGLILNIMPCVLPVLSLKVLSVMRHGGGHNATVRQEFFATVLGILFSFFLLALGATALKYSGQAVGWGVQFQDPYFLIALIAILTLFACNLFGFFEFRLPAVFSHLGNISPHHQSLFGSFLEGSLVTVLATPCTAPFLGTALGFALSRGAFEIINIFLMMGLGLAFPFLLIAVFPKLATRLPKPGSWMMTVKRILGFLIIFTAIWLVYILIAEIGQTGALIIAMMMLLSSLILKKNQKHPEARKRMAWFGAALLIVGSFLLPAFITPGHSIVSPQKSLVWKPFEPEKIADLVREGKTVFVSITADWCLTCQANKYFVLHSKAVIAALKDKDVVAMEADWTNHDTKITAYLKSFNQYGIPFYAVYGCKNKSGLFLGQILTPQKVLDALGAEKCGTSLEK